MRYEGEPVDQGSIVFLPQEGGIKTGGQIIDGRYQVSAERGPPPGKHKVLLFWEKKTGDTFVDPDTGDVYDERAEGLPSQYQSEQTPLEVEITRGRNVHDFHLEALTKLKKPANLLQLARDLLALFSGADQPLAIGERAMSKPLLTDELWTRIEGLLPRPSSPGPKGGRPPIDNRLALEGILFVLKTGIQWEYLPRQFGCSGMTCWRRLRDWQACGVWDRLHRLLLNELRAADKIAWHRAVVDSASLRAVGGGQETGPSPTDRRKLGSKHHVLVDANGIPLAVSLTGANRNDVLEIIPLVANVPYVGGKTGRPRQRPDTLQGDRGYDSETVRSILSWLGIESILPKRNTEHGSGLGVTRWVVERTLSWLHNFRRLRIRWERRSDIHFAFLKLATCLICLNCFVLA